MPKIIKIIIIDKALPVQLMEMISDQVTTNLTVYYFKTFAEARKALSCETKVVIMDIPQYNDSWLRFIDFTKRQTNPPFIIIYGGNHASPSMIKKALNIGVDRWLDKPKGTNPQPLINCVNLCLSRLKW